MSWMKWLALVAARLAVVVSGLRAYGSMRWQAATQVLLAHLIAGKPQAQPLHYNEQELQGLPAPVQRYFRAVLVSGQPLNAAVRVAQYGTFNMASDESKTAPTRKAFTSQQTVQAQAGQPGFVWDARVVMAPGVPVHVHDACVGGEGVLHAAVLGLVTVAHVRGPGEVARGALLRFLAEAAWYPTVLLPSQCVRWVPVDC